MTVPNRVFPRDGFPFGLREGLPERLWIVDLGETRELFLDFAELETASSVQLVDGIPEPVVRVGSLCSWIRVAGLTPEGRPIVLGTASGAFWLVGDRAWLINWDASALEACFGKRREFHEREKESEEACVAAFPGLVTDIVALEPRLLEEEDVPLYWRGHLEGIASDLGLEYAFPWG